MLEKYTGQDQNFHELSSNYKRALELEANIYYLALQISKTRQKQNFNKICERLLQEPNKLKEAYKLYLQTSFIYQDTNSKYLYILQEASKLALNLDRANFR